AQLRKHWIENGLECDFRRYNDLGISPYHVHRSKEEHKQAIFVLAFEMAFKVRHSTLKKEFENLCEESTKNGRE
ncbi:MAG: hypothetical protein EFT35_05790, partial [Methanophagales archaeon ANME-1-THS]